MRQGIHFISGLPRSGSTLLAGILRQNPRFHAGMTSPVGSMYRALEQSMSRRNETAVFIDTKQRRDILAGLFTNYYDEVQADKVVFDTNRMWCAKLPAITQLFPTAKVICCVRDVNWIMDSIERLVRRNAFEPSGMFGYESGGTVFSRIGAVATSDGLVGYALDALKDGFFGEQAPAMILLEYEALVTNPNRAMRMVYDFIAEPWFDHDFDNVEYDPGEFDLALGAPGLHAIRRKVEFIPRQTILPPQLFHRYDDDMFWRHPGANRHNVKIISRG
ncbi:MAG: sulfotransferase [Mycolicibacterium sp.]|uniref:sulfotransferase family protein n=1 Tax=Mycolicibacterium sp. TaxID=2320850 RepID=UPI003D121453